MDVIDYVAGQAQIAIMNPPRISFQIAAYLSEPTRRVAAAFDQGFALISGGAAEAICDIGKSDHGIARLYRFQGPARELLTQAPAPLLAKVGSSMAGSAQHALSRR
jgi:hypothetical protein